MLFEPFRLDGEVPHIQAAIENQSRIRGIARTWQCCCHKLAAGVQSEEGACLGKTSSQLPFVAPFDMAAGSVVACQDERQHD